MTICAFLKADLSRFEPESSDCSEYDFHCQHATVLFFLANGLLRDNHEMSIYLTEVGTWVWGFSFKRFYIINCESATLLSDIARKLQILRDGFDSRLEPIAFDIYTGWLLTRRTQAHFAVSLDLLNF